MSIIALIPARGGSKGIPRKNIVNVAGQPLIAHSISAALASTNIDEVIVSTDDKEIAEIAVGLGASVPFLRPAEMSEDNANMHSVMLHALNWLNDHGRTLEALVLLQPTSPIRTGKNIDEAIAIFMSNEATSVVSVVEVPHQFNPHSVLNLTCEGFLRPYIKGGLSIYQRQNKPVVYARNGPSILISNPNTILSGELYGEKCLPYFMSGIESVDIDTLEDLKLAEQIIQAKGRQLF